MPGGRGRYWGRHAEDGPAVFICPDSGGAFRKLQGRSGDITQQHKRDGVICADLSERLTLEKKPLRSSSKWTVAR